MSRAQAVKAQLQADLAEQVRNRQGQALFYASEAYQTEGAIAHVVGELQAGGRKITAESLNAPPVPSKLSADDYFNSFGENRANMLKEVGGQRDPVNGGFKDARKAAAKASKYMIRQLDAAHQGGLDLNKLENPDVIKATLKVEANRGDLDAVDRVLRELNMDADAFVKMATTASDTLSQAAFKQGVLSTRAPEIASALRQTELDVAAVWWGKELAQPTLSLRRSPATVQRNGRVAGVLDNVARDGVKGFDALTGAQAGDFSKAVEAARSRKARGGELDAFETKLLTTADEVTAQARTANKAWRSFEGGTPVRDIELRPGQGLEQASKALEDVGARLNRARDLARMAGRETDVSRAAQSEFLDTANDLDFRHKVLADVTDQIANERKANDAVTAARKAVPDAQASGDPA